MISSLVLACMAHACGLLVMIYHWHGGWSILTMDYLVLHLLDRHSDYGFTFIDFFCWFSCFLSLG